MNNHLYMFSGPNQHLFEPYHKAPKSKSTCKKCHVVGFNDKRGLKRDFERSVRIGTPAFHDGIHSSLIEGEKMYTVFRKDGSRYPIFCTMTNDEYLLKEIIK